MGGDLQEGGCFCGMVRYRMGGEPLSSSICHRVSGRRPAGAQSAARPTITSRAFAFVSGQRVIHLSSPEVRRTFPGGCGTSPTYGRTEDLDTVGVTTTSLDLPEESPPAFHAWMEDKVGREDVDDGLPRFQQGSQADKRKRRSRR